MTRLKPTVSLPQPHGQPRNHETRDRGCRQGDREQQQPGCADPQSDLQRQVDRVAIDAARQVAQRVAEEERRDAAGIFDVLDAAEDRAARLGVGLAMFARDGAAELVEVFLDELAVFEENPRALEQSISQFGDSIIVGIDARGRQVATRGWTETTQVNALAFASQVVSLGVERIIYTDIARDGRLAGPNFEMTREVALASGARVTASGGVSSLEDIQKLCALEADGVDSVIVGKSLYEKRFTLKEALEAAFRSGQGF